MCFVHLVGNETYLLCSPLNDTSYVTDVSLGTFRKMRRATIDFVIPVCLSFRPHGTTRLPLD